MSQSYPTSVPTYPDTTGGEVLGSAGGGIGLSRILDDYGLDIAALAAKLGTGSDTAANGQALMGNGSGTSEWRALTSSDVGLGNVDNTSNATERAAIATLTNKDLSSPTFSGNVTGWVSMSETPDAITANGNRSYNMVFNSNDLTDTLSKGMRLKMTRTVTAPTQCTDLEASSSQYYSKTSPSGMTFTDDFVCSAWIKLESYPVSGSTIASRFNATSGWLFTINSGGQLTLNGYNGGIGNNSKVTSIQAVPLGKWVHVAAQLDMSAFTATTTTSYVMFDGVDVPATVTRAGTNPTALVQAGNLEIGGYNGGTEPFDGKIAQVAIYSAKVTQATILASIDRTLTGSETSLISAYSFNNTLLDLAATDNDLTANNSAVATATDSPFAGGNVTEYTDGTTEMGIVTDVSFSTNTTVVVQVPEGYAIPTTGGVSAVSYSTQKVPYGFPVEQSKWVIVTLMKADWQKASPTINVVYATNYDLLVPIGDWNIGYEATYAAVSTASRTAIRSSITLGKASATEDDIELTSKTGISGASGTLVCYGQAYKRKRVQLTVAQRYYLSMYSETASASLSSLDIVNLAQAGRIIAECAYL